MNAYRIHSRAPRALGRTSRSAALAVVLAAAGGCTVDTAAPGDDTQVESGIIGGAAASPGEWPWQLALRESGTFNCGAVVLNANWVLTAAHCVWGTLAVKNASLFTIVAGDHVLSASSQNEQTRAVSQIVVHPNYGSAYRTDFGVFPGDLTNDVALLRLAQPLTLNQRVRAIPLSSAYLGVGDEVWATGWGLTAGDADDPSDVLQEVRSAVVDPAECSRVMRANVEETSGPSSPVRVDGSHICMGKLAPNPHASCKGDSGGPLVRRDAQGNWSLVGITSWGTLDCSLYGVYGHVRAVKPWIESVINGGTIDSCSGRTIAGRSLWVVNPFIGGQPFVNPNTSACGTPEPPGQAGDRRNMYFTSLGGASSHWNALGANTLVQLERTNFMTFLEQGNLTAALAETRKYHVNWEEVRPDVFRSDLCTGRTIAGNTGWQQSGTGRVHLDIYTGACPFAPTSAAFFTSMGAKFVTLGARGMTSIHPQPDGFRIYVNQTGITATRAEESGWQLNWQGIPYGTNNSEACVGRTSPDSTAWVTYDGGGLSVDVDTSTCGETSTPTYLTSLGGSSNHSLASGVTSIYSPTRTGFRVYVKTTETVASARANKWHVNWKVLRN